MREIVFLFCYIVIAISLFLHIPFSYAVEPQSASCASSKPSINDCPSFYINDCKSQSFRESPENSFTCLQIMMNESKDKPFCTENKCKPIPECDSKDKGSLEEFYCIKGASSCPSNAPELSDNLKAVLKELQNALSPYEALIALDPKKIEDQKTLCSYKTSDIKKFNQLAIADKGNLNRQKAKVASLLKCSQLATKYLDSDMPEETNPALWEILKGMYEKQKKDINTQLGTAEAKIKDIKDAPIKISSLRKIHSMMCPRDKKTGNNE